MRLPLALKGLYWRRGISIAILLTAAVTTAAAALGPLYAMASSESTLRDELTLAPAQNSGLDFEQTFDTTGQAGSALTDLTRTVKASPVPAAINGYPTQILSIEWQTGAAALPISGVRTRMAWRAGECAHLNLTQGRCPSAANEAMVSKRTLAFTTYGWKLGRTLTFANGQTFKIVGIYTPKNTADPFWFGKDYFDAAPGNLTTPDVVDTVFVTKSAFGALTGHEVTRDSVDFPLDAAQIRLANVPALKSDVAAIRSEGPPKDGGLRPELTTGLTGVLAAAAHEQQLVDTGTLLVTLQLTLLGWFVLFQIVADAAESRGAEIALSKLRGHSVWRTLRFALAEPLVLLLVAIPIGVGIAVLAAREFAGTVLVPGTPVQLTWQTAAATAAAFAGGLIAAGLAGRRVLVRSVLEQWRRTTSSRHRTRAALVVDIAVAGAAVLGLVVLWLSGFGSAGDDTVALLAPGLLVLAVALVGTRLMPLLVRAFLPLTRASSAVPVFIASRQVVRRPAGLRLAALLAVALGLATFGVGAETVASANRTARAQAELGAAQVVPFEYSPGTDPIVAVRKADPRGTWAMATATWFPDGGNAVSGTVLAVDATRLAAVGFTAQGGESSDSIARALISPSVPALIVHATTMSAVIDASGLSAGALPAVQFNLNSSTGGTVSAESTLLRAGRHVYSATIPCADGCTFLGITWDRPISTGAPIKGHATVIRLTTGSQTARALDARLTTAGAWRAEVPEGNASDRVQVTSAGVVDDFSSHDGGYGGVSYGFVPATLPAIATPTSLTRVLNRHAPKAVIDGFNAIADFAPSATVRVLPEVLDDGVVMNLAYLQHQLPDFNNEAMWQVWLSPSAPADAVARLRAAGLDVQSTATATAREAVLARQGPALSLLLLLASAIAGSVLALGATAISIGSAARRRSYEAAALGAVGVSRPQLYWAALYEQAFVLGTAMILGVGSGILAAIVTLPIIPEFATSTPVQLLYVPQALPILVSTLSFVVLVLAAAAGVSAGVLRAAQPERLREAEE